MLCFSDSDITYQSGSRSRDGEGLYLLIFLEGGFGFKPSDLFPVRAVPQFDFLIKAGFLKLITSVSACW